MTTAVKRKRKKKADTEFETKTVPYAMLDDLCVKQQTYIEHRDTFMTRLGESHSKTLRHNYRLQERVKQLETQIQNQEDNFKIYVTECLKMWQELEACGRHENFLEEKVKVNLEWLQSNADIKH